jgi:hypothetical protein
VGTARRLLLVAICSASRCAGAAKRRLFEELSLPKCKDRRTEAVFCPSGQVEATGGKKVASQAAKSTVH